MDSLFNQPVTPRNAEKALEIAMDKYGGYLLWYFESLCHDHHEAENLSQQLWLHVYERFAIHQYQHLPLLKRKAYQLFVDHTRKRNVRGFIGYTDEVPEKPVAYGVEEASDPVAEAQIEKRFWEQFPTLGADEKQKQAFWLKHRYGYTLQEISEKLGVASSTIHDWIKTVKKEATDILNKEGGL